MNTITEQIIELIAYQKKVNWFPQKEQLIVGLKISVN